MCVTLIQRQYAPSPLLKIMSSLMQYVFPCETERKLAIGQ